MLSEWLQLQWVILPVLAIPLAILLGMRWTNGAILACGIGAVLAIAFTWYRNATTLPTFGAGGDSGMLDSIFFQVGWVLLIATWTLTLAHAIRAHRWAWLGIILVGGYLSYSAILLSELLPVLACSINLPDSAGLPACSQPDQAVVLLIALGKAVGPAIAIVYALRAPGQRRPRQPLEGLVVSSLRDGHDGLAVDEDAMPAD
ncbi:MAG TPA: hypothetical protein VFQ32_03515 [Ktedonobacterales bacterium]|nr:hypothetical protein [Ktedonobacterales bacterium]